MKGTPETLIEYPVVLSEQETLYRAIDGWSIARYGDGELRLADGGHSVSQIGSPTIRHEMRSILIGRPRIDNLLVCIPHMRSVKYEKTWIKYEMNKYILLYRQQQYGSAFITRPDSAPWIDNATYWADVRKLWIGKDIIAVLGPEGRSLREGDFHDAKSVRYVYGPRRDAFEQIKELESGIGELQPGQRVILCLGACATILAARLTFKYRAHAIDLGHIGRMMRSAGRWSGGLADGTE